jgi:hypothetical protein
MLFTGRQAALDEVMRWAVAIGNIVHVVALGRKDIENRYLRRLRPRPSPQKATSSLVSSVA